MNFYDKDILTKLGLTGQGLTLREAVERAVERKKKGHVLYAFKRTPKLRMLLKAYRTQAKIIDDDTVHGTAAQAVARVMGDNLPADTIIKLGCLLLKMRVQFGNMWREMEPMIRVRNEGRAVKRGDRTIYPGVRIMSLNASEETRKKLKL
jgi:hypothetical protein